MNQADSINNIPVQLDAIEQRHGVRIVLAVEAGSRACGTASPDSGHDIRYVYAQPARNYVSPWVEQQPMAMQAAYAGKVVCTGMDLRQLMRELATSHPDVVAWLQSPLVYRQHAPFLRQAQALLPAVFCTALAIAQYRQRAWCIRQRHLMGETVWPAMYLAALSALLAAAWVERHGTPPPLAFDQLLHDAALQPALQADMQHLLLAKRSGAITTLAQPNGALDFFIGSELQRQAPTPEVPPDAALAVRTRLEQLFQHTLQSLQG